MAPIKIDGQDYDEVRLNGHVYGQAIVNGETIWSREQKRIHGPRMTPWYLVDSAQSAIDIAFDIDTGDPGDRTVHEPLAVTLTQTVVGSTSTDITPASWSPMSDPIGPLNSVSQSYKHYYAVDAAFLRYSVRLPQAPGNDADYTVTLTDHNNYTQWQTYRWYRQLTPTVTLTHLSEDTFTQGLILHYRHKLRASRTGRPLPRLAISSSGAVPSTQSLTDLDLNRLIGDKLSVDFNVIRVPDTRAVTERIVLDGENKVTNDFLQRTNPIHSTDSTLTVTWPASSG